MRRRIPQRRKPGQLQIELQHTQPHSCLLTVCSAEGKGFDMSRGNCLGRCLLRGQGCSIGPGGERLVEPRMCEQFKYMVLSCTSCVKCVSLKCTCVSKYGLIRLDQPRSRMFDLQPFRRWRGKGKIAKNCAAAPFSQINWVG